jgi:hypothetical protein
MDGSIQQSNGRKRDEVTVGMSLDSIQAKLLAY